MKRFILYINLVSFTILSYAQIQRDYVHPVTSSPTVSELARYGNIPVSLSSGTVNISVPIYNLTCGPLSVPVSLSYNGSGIKVNQISSNVGLGWSLNAGGIINVEINGNSDITAYKRVIKDTTDFNSKKYPEMADLNYLANSLIANQDTVRSNYYIDSQPDMFTYNFQGYAGNFVLDTDMKAYIMNDSRDLNIVVNKENNTFTITDNKGVVYTFLSHETTKRKTFYRYYDIYASNGGLYDYGPKDPDQTKSMITAYFLTSITSPDGKHRITFGYEPETTQYNTPLSGSLIGPRDCTVNGAASYTETTNNTMRVSSINTSDGYSIIFKYNLSREDIKGNGRALTSITINDYKNNPIRSYILNQSYFESTNSSLDPTQNKRLKLNHVVSVEENTYHRFTYNENLSAPPRNVYGGQDRYGYFNGSETGAVKYVFPKVNETIDLPAEYKPGVPLDIIPKTQQLTFSGGSNQNVNPNIINTFSLKEIHYPTGGYSSFEYEPNYVSYYNNTIGGDYWGGMRIKSVKHYSSGGDLASYKNYTYSGGSVNMKPRYWSVDRVSLGNNQFQTRILIHSTPCNTLFAVNGDNLIYGSVIESDDNGYIIHYFNSFNEIPTSFNSRLEYLYYTNNTTVTSTYSARRSSMDFNKEYGGYHFARGLEYKTEYRDRNFNLVKDINRTYSKERTKGVNGMQVIRGPQSISGSYNDYDICLYSYNVGRTLLASEATTEYPGNMETVTNYTYNSWNAIKASATTNSNGNQVMTITRYPDDINSGIYAEMKTKQMLNYPIEEILTQKQASKGILNTYRTENNMIVLDKIYSLNKTGSVQAFNGIVPDPAYSEDIALVKYDTYGNINEVRTKDGLSTTYLWSYKGRYPVAEIKNKDYASISASLGSAFISNLLEKTDPTDSDIATIRGLNSVANVLVTTYKHAPMVGINNIIEPDNKSTAFSYDKAGRLTNIINNLRGETLSKYDYNYERKSSVMNNNNSSSGLSIYTMDDKYEVLGDITFYISDNGQSSGDYTYSWSLKNASGKILSTSTQNTFTTNISEGGMLTVSCTVTDRKLNTTKTVNSTFEAYYKPLSASLDLKDTYFEGSDASFKISVSGGSGKRTFVWTLKDASGTIIKTETNNNDLFSYTFPSAKIGNMTLTCVLTDNITQETQTLSKPFSVSYRPLEGELRQDSYVGINIPETYSVSASGGSGQYSYSWTIKGSASGSILYTSNSASFEYTAISREGSIYSICIIRDNVTGETKELSKMAILTDMIKLKNIENKSTSADGLTRTMTADIWSSVRVGTVVFSSYATVSQGSRPTVTYSTSSGGSSTYQTLQPGKTTITVTIVGSKGTRADVGIEVVKYSSESVRMGDNMKIGGFNTF